MLYFGGIRVRKVSNISLWRSRLLEIINIRAIPYAICDLWLTCTPNSKCLSSSAPKMGHGSSNLKRSRYAGQASFGDGLLSVGQDLLCIPNLKSLSSPVTEIGKATRNVENGGGLGWLEWLGVTQTHRNRPFDRSRIRVTISLSR